MLSKSRSDLQRQQRRHRRQQSTPTAFEAPKAPFLPATSPQRLSSHRRHQSLDHNINARRQLGPQDHGLATGFQQQFLQEQQQRLVGPSQQLQQQAQLQRLAFQQGISDRGVLLGKPAGEIIDLLTENSNTANITANQHPGIQNGGANSFLSYSNSFPMELPPSTTGFYDEFGLALNGLDGKDFQFPDTKDLWQQAMNSQIGFQDQGHCAGPTTEGRSVQMDRPSTPPNQNTDNYYPVTPSRSPLKRLSHTEPRPRRREVLSPVRRKALSQRSPTLQNRSHGSHGQGSLVVTTNGLPSPHATPIMPSSTFDAAPMPPSGPNGAPSGSTRMENDFDDDSSYYSPMSSGLSPSFSSLHTSPDLAQMPLFESPMESMPTLTSPTGFSFIDSSQDAAEMSIASSPSRGSLSPGPDDLLADAVIRETGITLQDIACYIDGPDPADGKWICLFEDCNKRFGRKENIKSHVQTHLGDRQYQCSTCNKCFVRQHDLKRHSKIHTGAKPYPCACGNSFARHDALTRHRQRGMCIGAFEGVVKKVVKRGRPRKIRPEKESEARITKRRGKSVSSSTSSSSGGSNTSRGNSPANPHSQAVALLSPFNDFERSLESGDTGVFPKSLDFTPPTSPGNGLNKFVSPQETQHSFPNSQYSLSPTLSAKRQSLVSNPGETLTLPSHPSSPTKSSSSIYATPPELSMCSSSPPPTGSSTYHERLDGMSSVKYGDHKSQSEFDDLINNDKIFDTSDPFNMSDGMTTFEKDPSLLLLEKFEEVFAQEDMLSDNGRGDPFFGSP